MYPDIKPNTYLAGPNGPAIRHAGFKIPLEADKRDYEIEEKTTLERNILVGVWVVPPGTVIGTNLTVPAAAVFNSAFLNLRVGSTDVVERLYLQHVLAKNLQGEPYELSIPQKINLTESSLQVMNEAAIEANTALEIQFDFVLQDPKRAK